MYKFFCIIFAAETNFPIQLPVTEYKHRDLSTKINSGTFHQIEIFHICSFELLNELL